MNKQDLIKMASHFVENSEDNYITRESAISENVAGMKIFDEPIFAFGSADDEYFTLLKEPSAIGKHFLLPKEWLPQSKTVISFFLPFSQSVKNGNKKDMSWPSEEWLHGRIEGQSFLNKLCMYLKSQLVNEGYNSIVPSLDERFWSKARFNKDSAHPEASFTSTWSERHVAFVCGLGTFGLSKGLITSKGIAGRFGSIVTELDLCPDKREYENIYEYCSMCGACARNCPANAISIEYGKNHIICSEFLDKTAEKHKPRYGCGKCQINVPCEYRIPKQYNN
ncbi:4Fe-4S binding protein [Clostridium sp. DJ247]|uniref:4Fe-4S binding protein n=1 Tax=Clostridium sp. DJ247 TaxID=2726188 RepID=UPI0016294E23|nr:4Fe-4S binding protein [Clostridium sp. DJ247]MBC2581689.1 4Fe-4S binding protein [Clostridium sp. DJ247]